MRHLWTRGPWRKAKDEPIEVKERRYGYFPRTFCWRGHSYLVDHVERCWTVPGHREANDGRLCFQVRCSEGRFIVYQDLLANTWHIDRSEKLE